MINYVYWSGPVTKNTEKLAIALQSRTGGERWNIEAQGMISQIQPRTVLLIPTYHEDRFLPAVAKLLRLIKDTDTQDNLLGIIGTGNANFGPTFALAGKKAAQALQVPYLGSAELAGQSHERDHFASLLVKL